MLGKLLMPSITPKNRKVLALMLPLSTLHLQACFLWDRMFFPFLLLAFGLHHGSCFCFCFPVAVAKLDLGLLRRVTYDECVSSARHGATGNICFSMCGVLFDCIYLCSMSQFHNKNAYSLSFHMVSMDISVWFPWRLTNVSEDIFQHWILSNV